MIVTFKCSNDVHVYKDGCGVLPMWPYKSHGNIEEAIKYLNSRSVKEVKIIEKI